MPPWLEHLLSGLSPEGSITSFIGTIATFVALVIVRVTAERRRLDRAMASVPPTVCPVPDVPRRPSEGTVIATARRTWELEQQSLDLRTRLSALDRDKRAISADLSRTAGALRDSQQREEALRDELRELRDALDSGYARLPLPPSRTHPRPIDVVEVDARDTPRQGTKR